MPDFQHEDHGLHSAPEETCKDSNWPSRPGLRRFGLLIATCLLLLSCSDKPSEPEAPATDPTPAAGQALPQAAPEFNEATIPNADQLIAEFASIANSYQKSRSPYLGFGMVDYYEGVANSAENSGVDRMKARLELVRQLLKDGAVDRALDELKLVSDWLESKAGQASFEDESAERNARISILWVEGIAWLRKAEVENCITRNNADCCIFPLAGGGLHEVSEPAVNAMNAYLRYLELDASSQEVLWLLNLSAMAADKWPEGLPEQFRLPEQSFADNSGFPKFENIASHLGIDTFNLCGGCIVDDFNGDGLFDIVSSTMDFEGPLQYFASDGKGGFTDLSRTSGLSLQKGGLNCIGSDYDNDGDLDILVLRGAWLMDDGLVRNSLLRNNGDGTFSDVTRASGMNMPGRPTQAACWHDFNNDGWLDLYVANESRTVIEKNGPSYPARLWVNNTNGTFTERAVEAGCENDEYAKGVSAGDFDNDGLVDIFVSNVGRNRLYRNLGGLRFEEVGKETGVYKPEGRSFVPWFYDYDNDGWLDLFVAAFDMTIGDLALQAKGLGTGRSIPILFHNEGDGSFSNRTQSAGLEMSLLPMGANFGDIDNDGWLDMYLATGDPEYETLMPNVMLRNLAGQGFGNVTYSGGFGHLQKGHGVAFADLDNDGDQDIYNQLGGFYPGDKFANALFLNPGMGNHWLKIRLEGTSTNRQGNGVRIRLVLETPAGSREIHRAAGSVSSFGGSPRTQEIGLGDATSISMLELYWPVSGTRQQFSDVPLDSTILIREDTEEWERIELPVLHLHGGSN